MVPRQGFGRGTAELEAELGFFIAPDAGNDPDESGLDADLESLLAANRAFYEAFEGRDLDAMSELWEHSDRVVCTHPGWPMLRGWGSVAASWFALFGGPQEIQFILTNVAGELQGDIGWVSVDENLLSGPVSGTVAALNLFTRTDTGWQIVIHHAAPVSSLEPGRDAESDPDLG